MQASAIITRARTVLNDADGTRWTDSELISWINSGQRVIALVRPDSVSENAVLTLAAGTKQTLPGDGSRLLDVVRNIGANNAAGRAVRYVDRETLDVMTDWHTHAQADSVKNWVYDGRDPTHFYVYPPAKNTSKLEILYAKNPTDATTSSSVLSVQDLYEDPLLNYVLHRAYGKEAEYGQNAALSSGYLQASLAMLGVKTQKDVGFSPELNSKGANPNAAALQVGGV